MKQIIEKVHTQQNAVSLNNADSLSMHLDTRLNQLDSAIGMELWQVTSLFLAADPLQFFFEVNKKKDNGDAFSFTQEAFKAVEDIHDLIVRSKKVPKPSSLASYFENVSLVFLKSGNHLFHAAACHRLFLLFSEQKKNPSPEEITR